MLQQSTVVHSPPAPGSTTHFVHALIQFLVAVRYRKNVAFTALVVAGLVGGLYYATATRYFEATAAILVMGSGSDGRSLSVSPEGTQHRNLMPTFESLVTSARVVEGALEHLRPEDRIDMAGAPEESWPAILKKQLSAGVIRGTNIIEIHYRSKDPQAAVSVVNAIVQSYFDFLDETHKGTAGEIIRLLTEEKVQRANELVRKQAELEEARRQVRDIGIRPDSGVLHPVTQRALKFNEELISTQNQRAALVASLAAIQRSVRNGEDLQQHIISVADVVGTEFLLSSIGLKGVNSYAYAEIERQMLGDIATLESMWPHLGPAHPDVIALQNKIQSTQQYLTTYQQRVHDRLAEIQSNQLGPMLINMVQQRLNEVWQKELAVQAQFEEAEAKAVELNTQLSRVISVEHDLEWLRSLNDHLLNKLAAFDLTHGGQEVRRAVVQEPVETASPVSPNLRRVTLMTLIGGLIVGLGLVYVLDILDDRFRSVEEIQNQLNVPVLAMVRRLKVPDTTGLDALQMHVAPDATECEAFRTLRTALALADRQARQIVISSAEPGDGKTTVLANLAVSYAQSERKTLLIDADLRRPGLTAMMGMRGIEGLSGIVRGEGPLIEEAAVHIRASGIAGLDVLPSGPRPANPAELLGNPRFSELLAWAETVYDQILIDSPPALAASDAAVIGRLVDGVVLVVQPEKNRRRSIFRAAESFTVLKIPLVGIVVNRIGSEGDRGYYGYGGGYGYSKKYGAEEEEDDEAAATPREAGTSEVDPARLAAEKEVDFAAAIVPRRVA